MPTDDPAEIRKVPDSLSVGSRQSAFAIMVFFVSAGIEPFVVCRETPGWEPRNGLQEVVPAILKAILGTTSPPAGSDRESFIIYTYGEPAALFQLRLAGARWVLPVKDLEMPKARLPTYLLFGRHALRTAGFDEQFAAQKDRLRLVARIPCRQSLLVRLDESPASEARETILELYEVR